MISTKDFNDITARKRRDMAKRFAPKYWKSGKRAGMLRDPGREIPFTLREFREWTMNTVGLGSVRCHYCPRPIDVLHFEADHYRPVELGGGLGLDNLVAACEDCNRLKGAMPPADFIALTEFLETRVSHFGRSDVLKRLRSGEMGLRMRFRPGDKKSSEAATTKQTVPVTDDLEFF